MLDGGSLVYEGRNCRHGASAFVLEVKGHFCYEVAALLKKLGDVTLFDVYECAINSP
jgi:hypothetical protein